MRGWRAKIGLIVPSINSVIEPDFYSLVPEGVAVCATRMREVKEASLAKKMEQIVEDAKLAADAEPDIIALGCTNLSFSGGVQWNQEIEAQVKEATGVPCITAATAMVAGLKEMLVSTVALATPYPDPTNKKLLAYMGDSGFTVKELMLLSNSSPIERTRIPDFEIFRSCRKLNYDEIDGLFISCTLLDLLQIIGVLENDISRPVVTSTQALVWLCLRNLGIANPIPGFGQLLTRVKS